MIFLCFSSKDRLCIVEALLYHITNFGIPVWYDRKKMLLGDDRNYMNFVDGVASSDYALVVLSPNAISSPCVQEEMDLIKHKYMSHSMHVFPVFYNIRASELPDEYTWLLSLVYKEIEPSIDARGTCNHIICKYLSDKAAEGKIRSLSESEDNVRILSSHPFISRLSMDYNRIDNSNLDAKMALLYAGCQYAILHMERDKIPPYALIGVDRLFSETKLHLPHDQREGLISEKLYIILVDRLVSCDIV